LKSIGAVKIIPDFKESAMKPLDVYPSEKRTQFTRVKDKVGNEYICAADVLKDPKKATREELRGCIDESKTPQPFAGG
jgi:hypothetical protein